MYLTSDAKLDFTLAGTSIVVVNQPCLSSRIMPCNQLNGYWWLPLLSQKKNVFVFPIGG